MAADLTRAYQQNRTAGDLAKLAATAELRDSWDTGLRVERLDWDPQHRYYRVRSAGPDKRFDTSDDLSAMLEVRTRKIAGPPISDEMSVDLQIEHDRGPFNGRAEIVGSVKDVAGAAVQGATITARETATGATRTATTNAAGQFTLAGLAAGEYQLRVSSPGFRLASRAVTLKVRDRAVLSAVLSVGSVTEAVEVAAVGNRITIGGNVREFGGNVAGFAGGIAGGAPGGALGGVVGGGGGLPVVPIRGQFDAGRLLAAPPPPAKVIAEMELAPRKDLNSATLAKKEPVGAAAPHVRAYFPEALYINPEIVTDRDG